MQVTKTGEEERTGRQVLLKRRRKANILLIFFVLSVAFVACNQATLFEEGKEFSEQLWHKDSTLVFEPVVEDTSQVINIGFSLQHNNTYPYSNLWLFVEVEGPDGTNQTDTMEYFLAEPNGRWIGKGNDSQRTLYWLYRKGVKLSSPGRLKFSVTQGMRRDELPGVHSFSLWVEKAGEPGNSSD